MFFGGGGGDMDDIMSAMFGGGMPGGRGQRRRKGKTIGHALPVSLEDLYRGKTVTLPREKTALCNTCKGSGSNRPGQTAVCQQCRGRGYAMQVQQMGGMMMQQQVVCPSCRGQGSTISEKDKCKTCKGERVAQVDAPLKVQVLPGMENEQQIPFVGEGDQHPDIDAPGDVIVVLQQLKHDIFTRDGNDLHMKKTITLAEALCGFQFTITHLDNRTLVVRNEFGVGIIKPGDKKCIVGEGMPILAKGGAKPSFGDLIIEFQVTFPERMDDADIQKLRLALPPPAALDTEYNAAEAEECFLHRQPLDEVRREMEKQKDDDEEDDGQGQGIQCAHQ